MGKFDPKNLTVHHQICIGDYIAAYDLHSAKSTADTLFLFTDFCSCTVKPNWLSNAAIPMPVCYSNVQNKIN